MNLDQLESADLKSANYDVDYFTSEHLKKLAEDPKNVVYTFTHDKPTTTLCADEARDQLRLVRARFLQLKQLEPGKSDDELRDQICNEKLSMHRFAKSHKLCFQYATNSSTTDENMKHAYMLIFFLKQLEEGELTEQQAKALVLEYAGKHFGKPVSS